MSDAYGTSNPDPELANEIHNSNRILKMDSKVREIIDYAKQHTFDGEAGDVLKTIIDKLEEV